MIRAFLLAAGFLSGAAGLGAQTPPDTTVRDSAVVLAPLVVTVARTPQAADRVPWSVSVRQGDLARGRPGLQLAEALATVPGVSALSRFNAARDDAIAIRGFGARSAFGVRGVRILLDGIPQTLPDGQGQLTNIDLADVDRIEVLRGAASALYGNAAGGVISLRTAEHPARGVTPEARLLAGDAGTLGAWAGVTVPTGEGALTLRGARVATDGFRAQSGSETWRVAGRWAQRLGPGIRLVTHVNVADLPRADDPGTLTLAEFERDPGLAHPAFVASDAGKDLTQAVAGVSLTAQRPSGVSLETAVFALRRDLFNRLPFVVIDLDRWAWGARSAVTAPLPRLPAAPVLTVGLDAQWQRDDRLNLTPAGAVDRDQIEEVRELGPFLQVRAVPVARLTVTGGVRYDAVRFAVQDRLVADGDDSGSRTMGRASWVAGMVLTVDRAFTPFANVGTAFETPTTTELANRPDGSGGFNPDLDPQVATHVEAGVRGAGGPLTWSVAAFTADVRDELIPFEDTVVAGRRFFRNAGSSRHRGVELELGARPARGLTVSAAYTLSDLRFVDFVTDDGTFDGNRLPGVPVHAVSVTARGEAGRVWLLVESRYRSGIPVDDANTARTRAASVTDVRLGYRLRGAGRVIDGWVGLENVTDARYAGAVAVNANAGRYYEPGRPRALLAGFSLR